MASKVAALLSRNQAVVEALPGMTASAKFALIESLEQELNASISVSESQTIMDLYRVIEQDLWGWAMHTAFEERTRSAVKRKPLAGYMQPGVALSDQLRAIAEDRSAISPADRFALLRILNERGQGRAKPIERSLFWNLHQLIKQSLWTWMAQKAMEDRAAGPKKRRARKKVTKVPARKGSKAALKKATKKAARKVSKKKRK